MTSYEAVICGDMLMRYILVNVAMIMCMVAGFIGCIAGIVLLKRT